MVTRPVDNMDAHVDGAMSLYAGGDYRGAQALCRTVLGVDPDNLRALYLYGTLLLHERRYVEAIDLFERAIRIAPQFAGTRINLGVALRAAGRLEDASQSYLAAIALDPDNADVHMNLGNCFSDLGRYAEAETSYHRCLDLKPNYALGFDNLGIALREQGKLDEAVDAFRQAIRLDSRLATAYNNLGGALLNLENHEPTPTLKGRESEAGERLTEAHQSLINAVKLDPTDWRAVNNLADAERRLENWTEGLRLADESTHLNPAFPEGYFTAGLCLNELGDHESAVERYHKALALRPDYAEARYNLARCLRYLQRYDEAIVEFEQSIDLKPDFAEAHNALGALYQEILVVDKALACYGKAIELAPGNVTAHWNRALMRLTVGDYDLGLTDFEWRYKLAHAPVEYAGIDAWDGEDLGGARLLVRAEQGFGDTVQCARFLPLLKKAGAHVTLECQPALGDLLRAADLCDAVVEADPERRTPPGANFDKQVWLMSLPGILGVRFDTIPADVPYLRVPADRVDVWRERLEMIRESTDCAKLAGVVWAGSRKNANDHLRSMPMAAMEELASVGGVALVSLQQGPPVTQIPTWTGSNPLIVPTPSVRTFIDTAAMILALDVVITVDTVVAHIAGALGRPVWTLIPFGPDWRWSIGRDDSPWYPSMRLFRQPVPGDWKSVIDRVRGELTVVSAS